MSKVLVSGTHLNDIANAIRGKNGETTKYKPSQMASAIENISSGGNTPVSGYAIDDIATNNISGEITITSSTIGDYAFAKKPITKVNCNTLNSFYNLGSYAFYCCTSLKDVNIQATTKNGLRAYSFYGCTALEEVTIDCSGFENSVFENCTSLKRAIFPYCINMNGNAFKGCTSLEYFDIGRLATATSNLYLATNGFYNCTNLKTLVIRNNTLVSLSVIGTFTGTPFASGGSGGTLYVPQALIETYKSTQQWATILGYANNKILAIEGSEYE